MWLNFFKNPYSGSHLDSGVCKNFADFTLVFECMLINGVYWVDGHRDGWLTVRVAETAHWVFDGPKWLKNMNIESQMSMEMMILCKFWGFLWKTANVRLNPFLGPLCCGGTVRNILWWDDKQVKKEAISWN